MDAHGINHLLVRLKVNFFEGDTPFPLCKPVAKVSNFSYMEGLLKLANIKIRPFSSACLDVLNEMTNDTYGMTLITLRYLTCHQKQTSFQLL